MSKILHVIDALSGAGPSRSLLAAVHYLGEAGHEHGHCVVTLRQQSYLPMLLRARQAGLEIYRAPDARQLEGLVSDSDIVLLHYWSNPTFLDFLNRRLPAHRRMAWFKVLGRHAPQLISSSLLNAFDAVLVSSPISLALPAFGAAEHLRGRVAYVPGLMEPGRLRRIQPVRHSGFNVSYIGTANPTKMHPDFVAMSAMARVPEIRFLVCGSGDLETLRQQAKKAGREDDFEVMGFVENIQPVLEISDVFGYPLCADTWATSEKSLQEAMLAGVPPVVFPHGGIPAIVEDGTTGLVVRSASEYAQALEYLHRNEAQRRRMGSNAREHVMRHFDGRAVADRIERLIRELLGCPRREYPPIPGQPSAARQFAELMKAAHPEFAASLDAASPELAVEADRAVATMPLLTHKGEGGLLQFRNAHAEEGAFRFWSGLVAAQQGNWILAGSEFGSAKQWGLSGWRLEWYTAVAQYRQSAGSGSRTSFRKPLETAQREGMSKKLLKRLEHASANDLPDLFPF